MNLSLNFIWIAATQRNIPEPLMVNARAIADKYPKVTINIWLDMCGVGNNTPALLQRMNKECSDFNITFQSLDEIPEYTINPLFRKPHVNLKKANDPLWQRVDLARLLVLDYVLTHHDFDDAIYSDLDINLTKSFQETFTEFVTSPDNTAASEIEGEFITHNFSAPAAFLTASDTLNEHGLVVGRKALGRGVENHFIGIGRDKVSFLRDVMINETRAFIGKGFNGWDGLIAALEDRHLAQLCLSHEDILVTTPTIDPDKVIKQQYLGNPTPLPVQSLHQQP